MFFDGLIFDLDGTLWDSSVAVTSAWNTAIRDVGEKDRQITHDDVVGIMGLPMPKIFEKIFPNAEEKRREEIAEKCLVEEISVIRNEGAMLYPGVTEGIPLLAGSFPLFLVSNCQTDYLELFLETSGLGHLFKDSECHGNTRKAKADNIRAVIERNALKAPAYIGDTAGDQDAAGKARVPYFHVDYGFGKPIAQCPRFRDFDELVAYFLENRGTKG